MYLNTAKVYIFSIGDICWRNLKFHEKVIIQKKIQNVPMCSFQEKNISSLSTRANLTHIKLILKVCYILSDGFYFLILTSYQVNKTGHQ